MCSLYSQRKHSISCGAVYLQFSARYPGLPHPKHPELHPNDEHPGQPPVGSSAAQPLSVCYPNSGANVDLIHWICCSLVNQQEFSCFQYGLESTGKRHIHISTHLYRHVRCVDIRASCYYQKVFRVMNIYNKQCARHSTTTAAPCLAPSAQNGLKFTTTLGGLHGLT